MTISHKKVSLLENYCEFTGESWTLMEAESRKEKEDEVKVSDAPLSAGTVFNTSLHQNHSFCCLFWLKRMEHILKEK